MEGPQSHSPYNRKFVLRELAVSNELVADGHKNKIKLFNRYDKFLNIGTKYMKKYSKIPYV